MPLAMAQTIDRRPQNRDERPGPVRMERGPDIAANQESEARRHAARRAGLAGQEHEIARRHTQLRMRRHCPRLAVRVIRVQPERDSEDTRQEHADHQEARPRESAHIRPACGADRNRAVLAIGTATGISGGASSVMSWFSARTHSLTKNATQADFPHSQQSATIFSSILREQRKCGETGLNAKFGDSWQTGHGSGRCRSFGRCGLGRAPPCAALAGPDSHRRARQPPTPRRRNPMLMKPSSANSVHHSASPAA